MNSLNRLPGSMFRLFACDPHRGHLVRCLDTPPRSLTNVMDLPAPTLYSRLVAEQVAVGVCKAFALC
jgi:hypothetical protein